MNTYNKPGDNFSDDNVLADIISQPDDDKENGPHLLHLFFLVKDLYINNGVELTAISEMFKKHLTLAKIAEWKTMHNWDDERNKLNHIKHTLYGNAKQLVKMTLAVAKIDPTANNISAYKRAIESLIVLKKTLPVKNSGNKDGIKITPENIAEFAHAAGLDYNPGIVLPESSGREDGINNNSQQNIPAEE